MYAGLRKVLEIANDARVSDMRFRDAIQHMIDDRFGKEKLGFADRLEILHREAVVETDRDRYERQEENFSTETNINGAVDEKQLLAR